MKLGEKQVLTVVKIVDFGVYLGNDEERVLLPKKQVPEGIEPGDPVEVFLYRDSSDRLIATTNEPKLTMGHLAVLEVADTGKMGAFLDWGLEKDLFLPFKEQTAKVQKGDKCLVALYVYKSGRLCATMKVYHMLRTDSPYQKDDQVKGIVYDRSDEFGVFVAVRRAFEMFLDGSPFSFEELTPEVLDRFVTFLRERGNRPNTVSFYLRQWRAIYNRACADHVVFSDQKPFRRLNLKEEVTSKRAISREKIAQIECVDLTACHADMQLARDLFLFSFYTRGMSFVDMCYLNKENLQGNYLRYKRQKTGQELQIRIEKDLRVLIDRYASSLSDYLLPMLRNGDRYQDYRRRQRRLNKLIRELGDRLQLDMPLTFYVARHSWATLAHENDVPVSVISDCMGHTSEKTTRIYLDRIDTKRLDRANRLVINSLR